MTSTGSNGTNNAAVTAARTAATTAITGVRTAPTIATATLSRSRGRNSSQPTTRNGRKRIQKTARTSEPTTAAATINARTARPARSTISIATTSAVIGRGGGARGSRGGRCRPPRASTSDRRRFDGLLFGRGVLDQALAHFVHRDALELVRRIVARRGAHQRAATELLRAERRDVHEHEAALDRRDRLALGRLPFDRLNVGMRIHHGRCLLFAAGLSRPAAGRPLG